MDKKDNDGQGSYRTVWRRQGRKEQEGEGTDRNEKLEEEGGV